MFPLPWLLVSQRPIPPVEGSCADQAASPRDDDAPWQVPISFITAESVHASWMLLNGCTAPIGRQELKVLCCGHTQMLPVANFLPFSRQELRFLSEGERALPN